MKYMIEFLKYIAKSLILKHMDSEDFNKKNKIYFHNLFISNISLLLSSVKEYLGANQKLLFFAWKKGNQLDQIRIGLIYILDEI